MKKNLFFIFTAIIVLLSACAFSSSSIPNEEVSDVGSNQTQGSDIIIPQKDESSEIVPEKKEKKEIDFSQINSAYKFKAEISQQFEIEYLDGLQSINIYNPNASQNSNLEKSQIFIRKFTSSRFETLNTVNILNREETEIQGRPAVMYEIEKKSGVARFAGQPSWRSERHKLIDVRLNSASPSAFYVFSYNPSFGEEAFNEFMSSLEFLESYTGFSDPLVQMSSRKIIKPFGIFITPSNSPVSPEKFSGYHNALDVEILENENPKNISFYAICTGSLQRKATASGYGGYIVQKCNIENNEYNVLYGHVDIASIKKQNGEVLNSGEEIGLLGEAFSNETDGERGHLHLAIQRQGSIDIRGYVQSQSELSKWINPEEVLPFEA